MCMVCTYIGMCWFYLDFHLLQISCPVPAGVVSRCRNTLVNAGPLPACRSIALMTWELAAIPCSHVFIPMFAGWLSTRARKLRTVILFSVVNYRRLYDRMPPMRTKKCIVEGWWLTASVERRPPFPTRNENSEICGGIVVFSVPPLPLRRLVRSAFALYCCALRAVVLRLWFDDFQRVHEHRPFDVKNFKYVFDCFDCFCGEKITLLCLRFLHCKALACNASELRFRLAYFNFLDFFFGSRALRFSHWYFSFSNCGFSSFSISVFFLLYFFLSLKISFWDRQLQEVSFFTL